MPNNNSEDEFNNIVVGLVLVAGIIGLIVLWPFITDDDRKKVEVLRNLAPESVDRIQVFEKYGTRLVLTVDQPSEIESFVRRLNGSMYYRPNHPGYERSWHVWIQGQEDIEVECSYVRAEPHAVVGHFFSYFEQSTVSGGGSFISYLLRPWFEEHLSDGQKEDRTNDAPAAHGVADVNTCSLLGLSSNRVEPEYILQEVAYPCRLWPMTGQEEN